MSSFRGHALFTEQRIVLPLSRRIVDRFSRLAKRGFVRSVLVLVSGTAAGQAIIIAASPVLTRLYDPGEFGVLGVYVAILGVVSMVASLTYEIAIPLPSSDRRAVNVLAVALASILGVTGATVGILLLVGDRIETWTNTPGLTSYAWLIPVGVLFTSTYQCWNYWAIRKHGYSLIARTKLSQGLGSAGTQLGLGGMGFGPIGLILGQIVGQAAGTTALMKGAFSESPGLHRHVSLARMRWAASRYRRFPAVYSWSVLANALGLRLPMLLVAGLHGAGAAGAFLLAERVVGMPMKLVGTAVGQVYFGRAARLGGDRIPELQRLYRRLTFRLLILGGLGITIVAIGGPRMFSFLLGREWGTVGTYVQALGAMYAVQFTVGPVAQTLAILERQGVKLLWEAVRLFMVVGAFVAAWLLALDPVRTLLLYAGSSVASLAFLFVLTDTTVRRAAS